MPHLIRIALSHYQFETIHPFLDGNGRIGRLLITLYLVSNGLLRKPSLYLSDYFEKHKAGYYDALTVVRGSNDLIHWVKFFLVAVISTAEKGKETFHEIQKIREEAERKILELGKKAKNARKLLTLLYKRPIVSVNEIAEFLQITHQTANALVKDLVGLELLKEITGYRRNRVFAFGRYLALFLDADEVSEE